MKHTVTKIISILCLVAVLVCGTMPFANLSGKYKEMVAGYTQMFAAFSGEQGVMLQEAMKMFGLEIDFAGFGESINKVADTLNDGQLSLGDFYDIHMAASDITKLSNSISLDSLTAEQKSALEQSGMISMISFFQEFGPIAQIVGYVALAPLGLFGLLALAIVVRIILRLLNRRGLGVLITLLAILNAALMVGLSVVFNLLSTAEMPIGGEPTFVPFVIVGGCLASCIIWGIGRNSKVKVVKEEVIVEVPVETPVAPVEEAVVEEVVAVEEETVEEAAVEEDTADEEAEEEVVEA